MTKGVRTVSDKLDVRGKTINQIARYYFDEEIFVNRRYQRKLVWTLEEKRLFIDSLINRFPTPAIMLNAYEERIDDNVFQIYEIIDGLQRLDAIFSFIKGDFGIAISEECDLQYFDLAHIPSAGKYLRNGKLKQKEPVLPRSVCEEFVDCELPVILSGQSTEKIEEIFRRINSSGRKLSSQDLRQASNATEFPDLVRRIASRVRKDFTYDDRVNLWDMPKISIGHKQHGYGVDLDTVFWRRHDLINTQNIKESKDEEIIETLLATILLEHKFHKNKRNLDLLYESGTELNSEISRKIDELGKDTLEDKFAAVFDSIDMIFDSVNSDFSSFLFSSRRVSNKDEAFKALFIAIYRLLDEGYVVIDYTMVAKGIRDAADVMRGLATEQKVRSEKTEVAINNLYTLLKSAFSRRIAVAQSEITKELGRRLGYSKIESQMTEFKIGVSRLDDGKLSERCIERIAKTLVAMSNTNSVQKIGYVVIGVADTEEAYRDWYHAFDKQAVIVNQHFVPGVEREAQKLCSNGKRNCLDSYLHLLRKAITEQPISQPLKGFILQNFEMVEYHGVDLVIIKSKNIGETSLYDDEKYVREGNETVKINISNC